MIDTLVRAIEIVEHILVRREERRVENLERRIAEAKRREIALRAHANAASREAARLQLELDTRIALEHERKKRGL